MPAPSPHAGRPGRVRGVAKSVASRRAAQLDRRDVAQHLGGKGMEQQVAGLVARQAARLQVEQRVFVELADGGAVGALHVVGEDLELRVGVDLRVVREQQRPIGLLGVGLLRVGTHEDAAVEHRLRLAGQDALVELVAGAVRRGVVDRGVVVDELRCRRRRRPRRWWRARPRRRAPPPGRCGPDGRPATRRASAGCWTPRRCACR